MALRIEDLWESGKNSVGIAEDCYLMLEMYGTCGKMRLHATVRLFLVFISRPDLPHNSSLNFYPSSHQICMDWGFKSMEYVNKQDICRTAYS